MVSGPHPRRGLRRAASGRRVRLGSRPGSATLASRFPSDRSKIRDRSRPEQRRRAESEFLARASHEIRPPLTAILGDADLSCDDEDLTRTLKRGLQTIETIVTDGQRLLTVVHDIFDLS